MFKYFTEGNLRGYRIEWTAMRHFIEFSMASSRVDFAFGGGVACNSDVPVLLSLSLGPCNFYIALLPKTTEAVEQS